MSKKIMIISELFFPKNSVGSVRPTKLAKYLNLNGYDVTVFTSNECLSGKSEASNSPYMVIYAEVVKTHNEKLVYVQQTENNAIKENPKNSLFYAFLQSLKRTKRQYLAYRQGRNFYRTFCNYVDDGRLKLEDFDFVFSTFGPIGSLLAGMEAKKRKPSVVWINDFRDPMVSKIMPKLFDPYYMYLQKKSMAVADHVVTVSEGYRSRMLTKESANKFEVIPNGFDSDDLPEANPNTTINSLFDMTYVGALYEGKRDLSPLFKALKQLSDEEILPKEKMIFNYAGKDIKYLTAQAKQYGMEGIVKGHGFLSRVDCLNLQHNSRFLVLSTWNEKGEEGVFPGKFIEYMLMNKPIISVVDGNLAGSEVTSTIHKFSLGVSYESADKNTEHELYEWLKEQAVQFNNGKPAIFDPDSEGIEQRYNWKNIVKRFCELIDG